MKKSLLVLVLLVLLSACEGGKYSDVVALNEDFIEATQAYVNGATEAKSASDVAKVMNAYADDLEKIMPKMKKLAEKYPEIKNADKKGGELPENLVASQKKANELGMQMGRAMIKLAPYMRDPAVQAAQQRMFKSWDPKKG